MKARSQTFLKCNFEAKQKGVDLFPADCLEILEKNYGIKRMEQMKPNTIFKMIWELMSVLCEPDREEIQKAVDNWLNDY